MEAAKNAVKNVISRAGHHDTEVDETVNPAVTHETVKPHRHEETTQAIDREVHQDHYHTTVQPLKDREVLPEQHTHQQMPVQEREIHHGDSDKIKRSVETEAAKFGNTSTTHQTTHSQSHAPVAAGEHVHHHVHETVQPVIHKETVQPEVVHTTVPIHETHHAQSEHHGMSTLPTKTLDEFKSLGGAVTGASHRHEEYEGHPRPYNPEMQVNRSEADREPARHDGLHGTHASGTTGGLSGTSASNVSGLGSTGTGLTSGGVGSTGTALGGRAEGNTATRALDSATHGTSGVGHSTTGTGVGTTSGIGSESAAHGIGHSTTGAGVGRSLEHATTGHSSTSGTAPHHDRTTADTSSSTNTANTGTTRSAAPSDVQTPQQGKDPSLVESTTKSSNWRGEGVDGSHSAVFGLTPDGHKHDDTAHGTTKLKPAHSQGVDNSATGDIGSRAAVGGGVAEQMHDPRLAEKAHGGPTMSSSGSAKPGAGAPGGEQGFGEIRPQDHGTESKIKDKLDPTTDADGDGKRGVMD